MEMTPDKWAQRASVQSEPSSSSLRQPASSTLVQANQHVMDIESFEVDGGDASQATTPGTPPPLADRSVCPLRVAVWRHVSGSVEELRPEHLAILRPGSALFVQEDCMRVTEPHAALPTPLYLIPGSLEDWGAMSTEFVNLEFQSPAHVWVLLPSLMREPPWLRDLFVKHRDPATTFEVQLRTVQRAGLDARLKALLSGQYDHALHQTIRVFRSKRSYQRGEQLVLPGPNLAQMTDLMFSLAVSSEEDTQAVLQPAKSTGPDAVESSAQAFADMDWDSWHIRLVKAVKRNRVEDVKGMLTSAAWVHRLPSQDALISYIPAVLMEDNVLLVDIACLSGSLAMLCTLVHDYGCAMGYKALKFLMRHYEEVPPQYGTGQGLLLTYLSRPRRSPLACTSAIVMALRAELKWRQAVSPSQELEAALTHFATLQLELLGELRDLQLLSDTERQARRLPSLTEVLDGGGTAGNYGAPTELCQFRPLRVAFEDQDAQFFLSAVVTQYRRQCWLGADFALETQKDGCHDASVLNPAFMHLIMANLGFVSPPSQTGHGGTFGLTMRLWHLYTCCSQSFFDSPRGRWTLRLMANIAYLLVFMQVTFAEILPFWPIPIQYKVYIFDVFIAGFVVEVFEVVMIRYRGDVGKYIWRQPFSFFMLLCDVFMLAVSIIYLLAKVFAVIEFEDDTTANKLALSWSSMAVVVWLRVLTTLIPIFPRLGPLINTVVGMSGELFAFIVPWAFVIAGFSTALVSIFGGEVPAFNNIEAAVLTLFTSFTGSFDYGTWDDEYPSYIRLWGQLMMLIFQGIVCILLINLLIAIIAYKYRPDQSQAMSEMELADSVDQHHFQVEHHRLCSPFSAVLLPFSWLPKGRRKKLSVYQLQRWGLPFIDGFPQATPASLTVPTGADEIPHLIYLLTLHPLIAVATIILFFLHTPYCVLYFAFTGHKKAFVQLRAVLSNVTSSFSQAADNSVTTIGTSGSQHKVEGGSSMSYGGCKNMMDSLGTMDVEQLGEGEDPWGRILSKLLTWRGWVDLLVGAVVNIFAALVGALLYVVVIGLGYMVVRSLWAWTAALAISVYSILFGVAEGAWNSCTRRSKARAALGVPSSSGGGLGRTRAAAGGGGSTVELLDSVLYPTANQALSALQQQPLHAPYITCERLVEVVARVFSVHPTVMQPISRGDAGAGKGSLPFHISLKREDAVLDYTHPVPAVAGVPWSATATPAAAVDSMARGAPALHSSACPGLLNAIATEVHPKSATSPLADTADDVSGLLVVARQSGIGGTGAGETKAGSMAVGGTPASGTAVSGRVASGAQAGRTASLAALAAVVEKCTELLSGMQPSMVIMQQEVAALRRLTRPTSGKLEFRQEAASADAVTHARPHSLDELWFGDCTELLCGLQASMAAMQQELIDLWRSARSTSGKLELGQ